MDGGPSERREAERSVGQPVVEDSWNRAARSPPAGSASAMATGSATGHADATRVASVVTPGAPLSEHRATTVMSWALPTTRRRRIPVPDPILP